VEGGLGKAALATPGCPLAGQEATSGEGLVVLVAILEIIARVLLEEVSDVLWAQEQVDLVGTKPNADEVPMLSPSRLDKVQRVVAERAGAPVDWVASQVGSLP
jgi:hypothetical protein